MKRVSLSRGELAYIDRGQGAPILLVHGFPLDHTMWDLQIEALSKSARIIAPDLRGFGQSPLGEIDPQRGITMEDFADELAELLDALKIREPITFAGLSMGGYIAWQFVRKYANRLRALVLCDTRAIADSEEARLGRLKMAENVANWGSGRVAEMMEPKLFSAYPLDTRLKAVTDTRSVISRTPPATIAAAQRGLAARPDVTANLSAIRVPTLVLVGELDAISPPAEMQSIADTIPNAEFVVIPKAGHMTTIEKPAAVNEAIAEFLAGLN
jgi:3-oxoadipate enol-lactonase